MILSVSAGGGGLGGAQSVEEIGQGQAGMLVVPGAVDAYAVGGQDCAEVRVVAGCRVGQGAVPVEEQGGSA